MQANEVEGDCVSLLDLPSELLAAVVAHLPEDDELAAVLTCARLRKAVASSERRRTSLARTSTSTGSVFGSFAKLQWAVSCGLPVDLIESQFVRKAKYGPREHLRLLLESLPRLPLVRLKIHLTGLNLVNNQIGDAGAVGLGKALKANATLTTLFLYNKKIGDAGATGLGEGLKVNATLTKLWLHNNHIGDAGALGLCKTLEVTVTLTTLTLKGNKFGDASKAAIRNARHSSSRGLSGLIQSDHSMTA
jgi:hypothetical protein